MKRTLGTIAFAAALAFAGAMASTPAAAASNNKTNASNGLEANHAAAATDMSSHRRHWRRHRIVRPWPHVYPYSYGYYRPQPVIYPYSYGYYRPRPHFYAPAPFPFFSIGFGPRLYW